MREVYDPKTHGLFDIVVYSSSISPKNPYVYPIQAPANSKARCESVQFIIEIAFIPRNQTLKLVLCTKCLLIHLNRI